MEDELENIVQQIYPAERFGRFEISNNRVAEMQQTAFIEGFKLGRYFANNPNILDRYLYLKNKDFLDE